MPPDLFADPGFTGANLTTVLLYGAFTAVLFLLPFDLIERRGFSASQTGLILLPMGLVIGVISRFAGQWADRQGPRMPLVTGSLVVAFAAALFSFNLPGFWGGIFMPLIVISGGMAIVVAPLTTAVVNATPDAQSGAASGVNNAASRLAGLFAVAIVGSIATIVFLSSIDGAVLPQMNAAPRFGTLPAVSSPARAVVEAAFLDAYSTAMLIAAAFALLASLTAYRMVRGKDGPDDSKRLD
jgi:predicted MFS family arabinose efflux permease